MHQIAQRTERIPVVAGTDIQFAAISTLDGLSQIRVTNIVQDNLGFLWLGTQYGLNRFDGYEFKTFVHVIGDPSSMGGVNVTALFKDGAGMLWVGSEQSLDRFDPKQMSFSHYPLSGVKHISQDKRGRLWLSTSTGLYSLDPRTNDVRAYTHDSSNPAGLHINEIRAAAEDQGGKLWITDADGIHEFDPETGHLGQHIRISDNARDFSFFEDHLGVFWLYYSSGHGLASFDSKSKVLTKYQFDLQKLADATLSGITGMLEDRTGNLWLASQGLGLLKYDRDRKVFISYRHSGDQMGSLLEDRVNTVFQDKEGNIWAGLYGKGLERFNPNPTAFQPFKYVSGGQRVSCFYEDHSGNLWFGSRTGVTRVDHTGKIATFSPLKNGAALDPMNIVDDRSGDIWVGTFNKGLFRLNLTTGHWKNYLHDETDPRSLSSNIAARLMVDSQGTLWVATWDGLSRLDSQEDRFTVFRSDPGNRELQYFAIVEGPDRNIWLGTSVSGLQQFDPRTAKFTTYANTHDGAKELSNNEVNSIHVARDGALWLSTQNGLGRFDLKTGETRSYTSRNGLAGNALSCVLEDDRGQLWIATNKGISSFDPVRNVFRNFTTADGLPGLEMGGWGACAHTGRGFMMFSGFSGTTSFLPETVVANAFVPNLVFTDFNVPGQPPQTISDGSKIILSHSQNLFSLTFAALSYSDPNARRYRYMLEGLDTGWVEADSEHRSVTYTSLPAARYRFRVQSATSNDNWTEPGAELGITIQPPWWSTWWFRTVYICVASFAIWMAYQYRMRQLARQFEVRLQERVGERARIARELHDTLLQSFQGLLLRFQAAHELLPQRPADAKEALTHALRRADTAIVEGRDAVQDLRSNRDVEFEGLVEEMSRELMESSIDREISSHTVVEGTPKRLQPVVKEEIWSIVREAMRNAFLHSGGRNIETEIAYSSRRFRVRVRDDGMGISPEVLDQGRKGHWGLSGMRERADRVGASLELWSEVGAGTEVDVSVPGSIAYAKPSRSSKFQRKKARHP